MIDNTLAESVTLVGGVDSRLSEETPVSWITVMQESVESLGELREESTKGGILRGA